MTTAAAKSLRSCLNLCDPIDSSPPGSPVPGIFQARVLEWGAIAFSEMTTEVTAIQDRMQGGPEDIPDPGVSQYLMAEQREAACKWRADERLRGSSKSRGYYGSQGKSVLQRIEWRVMPSITEGLRKIRTWKHSLSLSRQTSFASLIKAVSEAKWRIKPHFNRLRRGKK